MNVPRYYLTANRWQAGLVASAGLAALLVCAPALAAVAPNLGITAPFGVISSTFTNANTATQTDITGNVCFTTGPVTPPITITGATTTPCAPALGLAQNGALAQALGQPCLSLGAGAVALDAAIVGANPPGVIPPGCYSSGGAMNITATTTVTLQGGGVYVFRPGGALNTGANSAVVLAGGACANDVYWAPAGAATIGANAALSVTPTFVGNIISAAGITIGHFATLTGRALAFGGTVTTDADTVAIPTCVPFAALAAAATPTLSTWMLILMATLMAAGGVVAMRRRAYR